MNGNQDFESFETIFNELMGRIFGPVIGVLGALAVIFGAYFAFRFWTAGGDEQKRAQTKKHLVWFFAGILVLFLIVIATPILIAALQGFAEEQGAL